MDLTPTHETQDFGAQVSALIKGRGLTLREVSAAADIPLATLHRRLRSQSMRFTLGELARLAAVLGTTAGAIVTEFEKQAAA